MHARRTRPHGDIAAALRARICMAPAGSEMMLHEGALATEFGVSRTPVRQALQRLAYEHLVQVRSGVGTVVVPLIPERRASDIAACLALLEAAADCAGAAPPPPETLVGLGTQVGLLGVTETLDAEAYFAVRAQLLDALVGAIPDEILSSALAAAHWRLTRWRLRAFLEAPETETAHAREALTAILPDMRSGSCAVLLRAAAASERLLERADGAGSRSL